MPITKNKNRFLQYEMWKDCHLGCKFCCNKGQKDLDKVESLTFILDKMNDPEVNDYNEIGFIGGEFFEREIADEKVKELFYKVFDRCAELVHQGIMTKVYFTTALIYDMDKLLIPFLNHLRELGILDKCLLCTSYDIMYRFHTEERENLWKNNMLRLHKEYPELLIHTETIMTQAFIDAVLEDRFSITEFCKTYHTRMDYIEPGSGLYYHDKTDCSKDMPLFFPTKSSYIKFLKKTVANKEIELESFLSMELRSSKLYYIDVGQRFVLDDRRSTEGRGNSHDPSKKYEIGFIDSDDKMVDIARELLSIIG